MTDDELRARLHRTIDARFSFMTDDPFLAQRIASAAKGEQPMKKKLATFPVLVTAILLLTLTVSLAVEAIDWHVLDWLTPTWNNPYEPSQPDTTGDTSHPVADIRIQEAVSDGYGIYLSVVCTPKQDNVLLLNGFTTPRDDADSIGLTADYPRQSIGSWADSHGYDLYSVRLYTVSTNPDLSNNTGFDSATGAMRRNEDGSIVIMMSGGAYSSADAYRLNYAIMPYTQRIQGLWEVDESVAADQQYAIAFSVDVPAEPSATILAEYAISPDTPPQYFDLTSCQLLRTPLATYVEYVYTIKDAAIAQMDRFANDAFNLIHPQMLFSSNGMESHSRELLPDGTVQFRILRSIVFPLEIPASVDLDVSLFVPGAGNNDLEELVTLMRNDQ